VLETRRERRQNGIRSRLPVFREAQEKRRANDGAAHVVEMVVSRRRKVAAACSVMKRPDLDPPTMSRICETVLTRTRGDMAPAAATGYAVAANAASVASNATSERDMESHAIDVAPSPLSEIARLYSAARCV